MAFSGKNSADPNQLVSLVPHTKLFKARTVAYKTQLDTCFEYRQHECDIGHICLSRPPLPTEHMSAFTRPVCECPDSSESCQKTVPSLKENFNPPSYPNANWDEFRERIECAILPSQHVNGRTNAIEPDLDEEEILFNFNYSAYRQQLQDGKDARFSALHSSTVSTYAIVWQYSIFTSLFAVPTTFQNLL